MRGGFVFLTWITTLQFDNFTKSGFFNKFCKFGFEVDLGESALGSPESSTSASPEAWMIMGKIKIVHMRPVFTK